MSQLRSSCDDEQLDPIAVAEMKQRRTKNHLYKKRGWKKCNTNEKMKIERTYKKKSGEEKQIM